LSLDTGTPSARTSISVLQSALDLEGVEVVDDRHAVLPRELVQQAIEDRDTFAEIARAQSALLLGPSRREIHEAHRRRTVLARAFVEPAIVDREPLRERARIVRVCGDDLECGQLDAAPRAELSPRRYGDRNGNGDARGEPVQAAAPGRLTQSR
jgi:hypothetical protein